MCYQIHAFLYEKTEVLAYAWTLCCSITIDPLLFRQNLSLDIAIECVYPQKINCMYHVFYILYIITIYPINRSHKQIVFSKYCCAI